MEAPIHTVFKTLGITPAQNISGPPFGRSWRAYRQQTTPEEAESFCFYARILAPALHTVLKKSGMSGIYITPKSELTNLADSRFFVIWASFPTLAEAITKAETYDYTLGVVRSSKEKPAYGIRVLAKDFDVLWKDLRPSDPKPTLVQGEAMYKIAPVPIGATHDDVLKWIAMEKLTLRPLRALNSSTWLLVGQADIRRATFTWKQNAVLLQPLESNFARPKSAILAGKRPADATRRVWRQEAPAAGQEDSLMVFDPWAQAIAHRRPSDWSTSSTNHESASSSSGRTASSRAPSEVQVSQQKEIDQMKSKLDSLESAMTTQRKDASNFRKEVHVELQQVRKEVADKVTEVQNTFQSTLTQALNQTQTALRDTFREDFDQLKLLLGASASARKRNERDNEDMEED